MDKSFQQLNLTTNIKNNILSELANAIIIAKGNRSVEEFAKASRVDIEIINSILHQKIIFLPQKNILRNIARVSQNRITYTYLCHICKFDENDPSDRDWITFNPERGSVYYVDLGYNMDSEQSGIRPCIVIQNNVGNKNAPTVQVAPITSRNKQLLPPHVFLTKKDGMREDSIICLEQIKTVSKRRFFHNGHPKKIVQLSKEKIFEVDVSIQKQLGIIDVTFNEVYASEMVKQLRILEANIKIKKSKDLIGLLNEKADKFVQYCLTYRKNPSFVMKEYSQNQYCRVM